MSVRVNLSNENERNSYRELILGTYPNLDTKLRFTSLLVISLDVTIMLLLRCHSRAGGNLTLILTKQLPYSFFH